MPPLVELQHRFAQAVMTGDIAAARFAGRVKAADALAVHRDTVMAALGSALRISYPTVDALVGEQFFDQTGAIFAEASPPKVASLAVYGEGFADFLTDFAPAAALPYLSDVARLDRAVETALRSPLLRRHFVLDATTSIALPQSLAVLRLTYPADEIRAALGDDVALAAIFPLPAERFILVWREGFEAVVRRVAPAAGCFLRSLLAGEGVESALAAATSAVPDADALRAMQTDIFAAPFCTVISNAKEVSP